MVKEFRFTQYPIVTDRQTHGHFATANTAPCITLRGKIFYGNGFVLRIDKNLLAEVY